MRKGCLMEVTMECQGSWRNMSPRVEGGVRAGQVEGTAQAKALTMNPQGLQLDLQGEEVMGAGPWGHDMVLFLEAGDLPKFFK